MAELYRAGIDRSKLRHSSAAHDLVAANVAPATSSGWAAAVRSFDDEFPLSIFYSSLKAKLAE